MEQKTLQAFCIINYSNLKILCKVCAWRSSKLQLSQAANDGSNCWVTYRHRWHKLGRWHQRFHLIAFCWCFWFHTAVPAAGMTGRRWSLDDHQEFALANQTVHMPRGFKGTMSLLWLSKASGGRCFFCTTPVEPPVPRDLGREKELDAEVALQSIPLCNGSQVKSHISEEMKCSWGEGRIQQCRQALLWYWWACL